MRQPPTYTSWRITCQSPEEARALQQWLSSRIDLGRVLTDTVRVTPNGVEQVQTVRHRLGDYFAAIRLLPDSPKAVAWMGFAATAVSLALTFLPPPGANALTFEMNLIVQAAIMLGVGVAFYRWSRRRPAAPPRS